MNPSGSGLSAPHFGSRPGAGTSTRTASRGSSSSGDSIPSDLEAQLRDCAQAHTRLQGMLNEDPGLLDLTVGAQLFVAHERPELLWHGLMRQLCDWLGAVHTAIDMYRDSVDHCWRTVHVPIEVRRLFTATGEHLSDTSFPRIRGWTIRQRPACRQRSQRSSKVTEDVLPFNKCAEFRQ